MKTRTRKPRSTLRKPTPPEGSIVSTATQLQGKELSFNNMADTDAALETVKQFDEPACVIVKHANPCGVAIAADIKTAYDLAFETDTGICLSVALSPLTASWMQRPQQAIVRQAVC